MQVEVAHYSSPSVGMASDPETDLWTDVVIQAVLDMKAALKAKSRGRECSQEMIDDAKDAAQYVLSGRAERIIRHLEMTGCLPTLKFLASCVMNEFK